MPCILGKERGSKTFICHLACESKRTRKIRKKTNKQKNTFGIGQLFQVLLRKRFENIFNFTGKMQLQTETACFFSIPKGKFYAFITAIS